MRLMGLPLWAWVYVLIWSIVAPLLLRSYVADKFLVVFGLIGLCLIGGSILGKMLKYFDKSKECDD